MLVCAPQRRGADAARALLTWLVLRLAVPWWAFEGSLGLYMSFAHYFITYAGLYLVWMLESSAVPAALHVYSNTM